MAENETENPGVNEENSTTQPPETAGASEATKSPEVSPTQNENSDPATSTAPDDESESLDSTPIDTSNAAPTEPEKKSLFKKVRQKLNIYLVIIIAMVIMATTIIFIAYLQSQSSKGNTNLQSQNLSQSALQQLANSDTTVGSSQYVLNVESNAIFAGQVIIRQGLEVASNLQVGGTGAFNNISVAGTGQFSQATINNNLTIGGTTSMQGSATIAKSLQVSGSGSFGGSLSTPQISTNDLQLNGDLVIQHHITVSGSIPTKSDGSALGNGGSVSIGGTDTAGSITVNTGQSPTSGCFVTITFAAPYNDTPHVLVTPIGFAAGGLQYYVTRTATNFSVCDSSAPPASSSFGFDYFIID
jgi:hypothetical protein